MAVHRAAKMAQAPAIQDPKRRRRVYDPLMDDDFYPTAEEIAALPDPTALLPAIATMVIEVIAGARSVDQLANLVSDQVYERLRGRVSQRAREDAAAGRPPLMPKFAIGKMRMDSPKPGIIESVVLVSLQQRTRAVTIRLEPFHKRWRATSVTIL
ncbi:MAG: hypothetical protein RJA35_1115 [Actinomycetota bacterium]|jgi:hypothetical protein